jgi:hypothetical protein
MYYIVLNVTLHVVTVSVFIIVLILLLLSLNSLHVFIVMFCCCCHRFLEYHLYFWVSNTVTMGAGFNHPGLELATSFSSFVNREGLENPLAGRRPTPFMPPTTVIATQLDALQRNDWPEPNAGVRTAFTFAKPRDCEDFFPGQVGAHPGR